MTGSAPSHAICPQCGERLPGSSIAGLCPRCILRTSLAPAEAPALVLGGHVIYEEIARGGMGIVYRARQRGLEREVAVKVLRGGEFASVEAQARFRTEAAAAARLQHPGIVAIHDVGEQDGALWFSMDFVPGENLAQRVREHPLAARDAAQCVARVADAVQHAHEHGVLHRDLKPSNILLDAAGLPRITDFGIAHSSANLETFTRTGQMLGSPGYAAPEQALGGKADARTDVYGLGALLYHLLTSRPPFQGPTLDSILLQLHEAEPISPRRLTPTVPRDLEVICLQALRKDPARRYATARELADDLTRFLNSEPIRARPVGPLGRALRWSRRRPWTAALLALVVLLTALLAGGAVAIARHQARRDHRIALIADARMQRTKATAGARTRALTALREAWKIQPSAEVRNEVIATLSVPEISLVEKTTDTRPWPTGSSADGRCTLRREGDALIVSKSGAEFARLSGFADATFFQLDDTGGRVAIVGAGSNIVSLHEIPSGRTLRTIAHPQEVTCLDWSGELLATGCADRFVYVWDAATGERRHRFRGHDNFPSAVRFRPRGQELVSVAADRNVRLWHAGRGTALWQIESRANHGADMWWTNAEASVLACARDGEPGVESFRFDWPRSVRVFGPGQDEPHAENIRTISVGPAAELLATVDELACRVWTSAGTLVAQFAKDRGEWFGAALANDGSALWLSGWNSGVQRFPIARSVEALPRFSQAKNMPVPMGALLVAQRADGRAFAFTQNDEGHANDFVWLHLTESGKTLRLPQPAPYSAALSPDGRWAVTGSFLEAGAQIWRLPEGQLECALPFPVVALSVAFSRDSQTVWTIGGEHVARWQIGTWTADRTALPALDASDFALSPDDRFVACLSRNEVRLLRATDLGEIARLAIPPAAGWIGEGTLAFSPDAATLALHTALGCIVVWHLPTLEAELRELGMSW